MVVKPTYEELEQRIEALENEVLKHAPPDGDSRESEEKFRLAFENANIGMCLIDPKGLILKTNAEMSNIFGYSQQELEGMTVNDIAHPEDLGLSPGFIQRASSGEITQTEFEKRYIHKEGYTLWGQVVSSLVKDTQGNPLYFISHVKDITEQKQAETALKESEEKYRLLVNNLPGIVYIGYQDWSVELYDNRVEGLTGYHMDEFNSGSLKWIDLIVQEDIEPAKQIFIKALKTDQSYVRDYRLKTKAGNIIWIQERGCIVCNQNGAIEYVSGVFYDITDWKLAENAIKESEDRFRKLYQESRQREHLYESLLNSTPDAVAIYNLDGETIFINPAFSRIFGFTMEDVQGKHIPFVPEGDMDKTKAGIEKVLGGEPVTGFETQRLTKDGRILNIALSSSCYYDHQGTVAGIVVFLRDVTEAKHVEKQLLHYNKMEAVGTLAGGIAHDFNNLLQAIQGYTEILLFDTDLSESGNRALQQILHAAKRGGELTRQLLTFSRKVESKKLLIDLNREVKQAQKILQRTIPKMIHIELDLTEPLKTIDADPTQVEQVIMNLAINAKDAMPEGGRLVIKTENTTLDEEYCRAHPGSTPGDYVMLTISDTGSGMDRKTQEHIFEPFFTTKELGRGTGLGLAIVYGIVKSHYGYITCHSKLDDGTIFKVYFQAVERLAEPEEQATKAPLTGGTETILLVDDEKYIRDLGKQVLEQFGYTVLTAVDGESALNLYRQKQDSIHLVILDLIMPGMGGMQCLVEMLKLNAQTKIIVISGYSDTIPIQETIETGAKDFIAKPFQIRTMLEVIRKVLDK